MNNFILGFKHMFAIERQDLLKFSHDEDDDEDKRQALETFQVLLRHILAVKHRTKNKMQRQNLWDS